MLEIHLFRGAFGFYSLSLFLAFGYLFSKNEKFSLWLWRIYGAGILLHVLSFFVRTQGFWGIPENRYFFPINTFFGALSYMALAMGTVFWLVEGRHRLHILGAFVLPWSVLASGAAILFADPTLSGLVPALQSYWINIHPMILMTSYSVFANAFGVGLALLIQERQIKSKKPGELCYRLPAIEDLDRLNYHLIQAAFPVLTLGIFLGGVWAYGAWGRFWGWDAKETWALITWFVYVVYLHMHFFMGWRGRRAVYLSMAGFFSVLFPFVGHH